jgi:hypothetical protein
MKAFILDPLALLGMKMGYNRPLDRSDFGFGSVPGWAGNFVPGIGEPRRFANLSGVTGSSGVAADMYRFDSTQQHPLGTMAITKDGRIFRYCQAGASDLVVGNLEQSAAPIANHLALTAAAEAIGAGGADDPIVVTPGATAGAANLYAEGTLMVDTTPGNGYSYRISGHGAITASTAFNLYLDPDDRIQVALTTSSRYGLHHNPYKNVIQTPTTITAKVVGVANAPITATYFGWLQTRGPAAVLINGTPAVTAPVINSATTAGAVDVWTAAAQPTANLVGHMMQVGVSGKNNAVYLLID